MFRYFHSSNISRIVCFVVGPYKTATSLATKIIESQDYYNPFLLDNVAETAVGLSIPRYKTRESKVVRELNLRILFDTGRGLSGLTLSRSIYCKQSTLLDVANFLYLQKNRIVIKDPLLCWTLPVWLKACRLGHYSPEIIFTSRNQYLKLAWQNAPFTKMLLRDSNDIVGRMIETVKQNIKRLESSNIPYMILDYDSLKWIYNGWISTVSVKERERLTF